MSSEQDKRVAVHTRAGWQDLTVEQIRQVWSEEKGLVAQSAEEARRVMEIELKAVSRRLTIDHLLRTLSSCPGNKVLEVGCGWGRIGMGMKEARPELDYTGVDLNPDLIAMGQRLAQERNVPPPYQTQVVNAEELPFGDASFDFVYGVRVFQYIPDQVKALRHASRVLKSGGRVAIVLPNRLNPARRSYHTKLFYPREIRQWLSDAGFTDLAQHFFGFWPKVAREPMGPLVRSAEMLRLVPGLRALGALIIVTGRKG